MITNMMFEELRVLWGTWSWVMEFICFKWLVENIF